MGIYERLERKQQSGICNKRRQQPQHTRTGNTRLLRNRPASRRSIIKAGKVQPLYFRTSLRGGHISEVLKAHDYDVTCADIIERDYDGQEYTADFLHDNLVWCGDIITNPPYKYAAEFVEHSLNVITSGHKVAMFLKLTFLEGEKRRELFQQNPPTRIYVFTKRINCALNGEEKFFNASSAVCYAWFVWEKGSKTKPVIDWI